VRRRVVRAKAEEKTRARCVPKKRSRMIEGEAIMPRGIALWCLIPQVVQPAGAESGFLFQSWCFHTRSNVRLRSQTSDESGRIWSCIEAGPSSPPLHPPPPLLLDSPLCIFSILTRIPQTETTDNPKCEETSQHNADGDTRVQGLVFFFAESTSCACAAASAGLHESCG
jgi:hypothetical protein